MNKQTRPVEFTDSMCLALGRQVKELLEVSSPDEIAEHLWEIYSGFTHFDHDCGYNPRRADMFLTFRELMFFCQRIERTMQNPQAL